MSAILQTFTVRLSEKQAQKFRSEFRRALRVNGLSAGAMLAQPVTQFGGSHSINLKPPVLHCMVMSLECQAEIQAVINKHLLAKEAK